MDNQRVLHCIPSMGGGGAERQLAYLTGGLTRLGWNVHVALVSLGPNLERLQQNGAEVHRLAAHSNYDPILIWRLLRTTARVRPAVMQLWLRQMEVLGAVVALLKGIPWVLFEGSSSQNYPSALEARIRAKLAATASAVVSNSTEGDLYWEARLGDRVPRYVVPNAVPFQEIDAAPVADPREFGLGETDAVILVVGRLIASKNVGTVLSALRGVLTRANAVAVFAGDGPERPALERTVVEYGLAGRVLIPGYLGNVWGWMKRANVFVSASQYEGQPNTVLEAMACRCPLVVSDIPAHRAFLDEESARFADPTDEKGFADRISDVLHAPEDAARRAENARRLIHQWSVDRVSRDYAQVYLDVLKTRDGSRPR